MKPSWRKNERHNNSIGLDWQYGWALSSSLNFQSATKQMLEKIIIIITTTVLYIQNLKTSFEFGRT